MREMNQVVAVEGKEWIDQENKYKPSKYNLETGWLSVDSAVEGLINASHGANLGNQVDWWCY